MTVALNTLVPGVTLDARTARLPVRGLALDSRKVEPGDVFLAVPGEQADGRSFIDAAIHGGAVAVLAEAPHLSVAELGGVPVIGIPRLRQEAGEVAARFYGDPSRSLRVCAVTGTNGKTSTAWFLRDALEHLGERCGLIGTLGIHFSGQGAPTGLTTPDVVEIQRALAGFRAAGARAAVMEASSHALAQHRLAGVRIGVGIFTNLSRDHLDYHGDMASYFAAKAKLFQRPELTLAVVNAADPHGRRLAASLEQGVRRVTFGEGGAVYCSRREAREDGLHFEMVVPGGSFAAAAPVFGEFNIENLMAVAGVLHGLGYRPAEIGKALAAVTPVPGRMEPVDATDIRVVVDYAHTPDGLEKALAAARQHFRGQLWCVVGCGGNRDAGKRPLMAAVAERLADRRVFTSDNPRFEEPQAILADMLGGLADRDAVVVLADRRAAIAHAVTRAAPGDVILIAGKGHETWQDVRGEKLPMDDRALAREAVSARGRQG